MSWLWKNEEEWTLSIFMQEKIQTTWKKGLSNIYIQPVLFQKHNMDHGQCVLYTYTKGGQSNKCTQMP